MTKQNIQSDGISGNVNESVTEQFSILTDLEISLNVVKINSIIMIINTDKLECHQGVARVTVYDIECYLILLF